ncbi:MAG: hypothetical protein IPH65_02205 [Dehalococcoidia bacterium]|uniref:hypothetical protein n=1 Tax=Candidatus Amarobacter glycogenicus TaxID=3140699 RepID=UPI0031355C46|nr:hypothetical protein [Dehalococcoidia bacterium]
MTGLSITNNVIHDLRQPAYMSGTNTGTISGNYTYRTRGWVVEGGNLVFTGNTWGVGANQNIFDIAILSAVGPGPYPDIPGMAAAEQQRIYRRPAHASGYALDRLRQPLGFFVEHRHGHQPEANDSTGR